MTLNHFLGKMKGLQPLREASSVVEDQGVRRAEREDRRGFLQHLHRVGVHPHPAVDQDVVTQRLQEFNQGLNLLRGYRRSPSLKRSRKHGNDAQPNRVSRDVLPKLCRL